MNKIDSLAEELGVAYQLIKSIKNITEDQHEIPQNEDIIVLSEYALGYLDSCFNTLLKLDSM